MVRSGNGTAGTHFDTFLYLDRVQRRRMGALHYHPPLQGYSRKIVTQSNIEKCHFKKSEKIQPLRAMACEKNWCKANGKPTEGKPSHTARHLHLNYFATTSITWILHKKTFNSRHEKVNVSAARARPHMRVHRLDRASSRHWTACISQQRNSHVPAAIVQSIQICENIIVMEWLEGLYSTERV